MLKFLFFSYLCVGIISLILYRSKTIAFYFGFVSNALISLLGALYFITNLDSSYEFSLKGFLFEPNFMLTPLGAFLAL